MRKPTRNTGCTLLAVAGFILLAILTPFIAVDPQGARQTLESAGYKDVQVTGYAWFSCAKEDFYSTGFTAISPAGTRVSGTVCRGPLFKASTIRFN